MEHSVRPFNVLGDPRERTVAQRFEAKYFLSEVEVEMLRDFISPYTAPDKHGLVYPVTSLYLDSADRATYRASLHGEKNRFKLRIRGYEGSAGKPLFAEVKQRIGRVIRKHRACLRPDAANRMTSEGSLGEDALLAYGDPQQHENLMLFSELSSRLQARPKIGVRYSREAYVSTLEEPVRITLDRDIAFARVPDDLHELWGGSATWLPLSDMPVVLEVKFSDAYPFWVRQLIQRLQLNRISLAKYVTCMKTMELEGGFRQSTERSALLWNG